MKAEDDFVSPFCRPANEFDIGRLISGAYARRFSDPFLSHGALHSPTVQFCAAKLDRQIASCMSRSAHHPIIKRHVSLLLSWQINLEDTKNFFKE